MEAETKKPPSAASRLIQLVAGPQKSRSFLVARDIVGACFWTFLVAKIFLIDIDGVTLSRWFPSIAPYRPLIVIVIFVLMWRVFGTVHFLKIIFFPAILFGWHGLRFALKHWMITIVLAPLLVASIVPLKRQVTVGLVATIAGVVALSSENSIALIASMIVLLVFIARHYKRQFYTAFAPGRFLTSLAESLETAWTLHRDNVELRKLHAAKALDSDSAEYKKQWWVDGLGGLMILNAVYYWMAERLRLVQQSQLLLIYSIVPLAYTITLSVLVFAIEYFALFKIDHSHFSGDHGNNFFFFVHFSCASFFTASFGNFAPSSDWARALTMAELICTMLAGTILGFIFTTAIRENNSRHFDRVIQVLDRDAADIESIIGREYSLPLAAARAKLAEFDTQKTQFLDVFRTYRVNSPPVENSGQ